MREIIAILRGVESLDVVGIGQALVDSGISKIEVPMNSPDALKSIELLVEALGSDAQIGAGTVLFAKQVNEVNDVGGVFVVSPNMSPDVISATKACGLLSYPGVQTVTECFSALEFGADGLKLFPASLITPKGLIAMSAVLPNATRTFAVGGVGPANFYDWIAAGATGFGIGTSLYTPGMTASQVSENSTACVMAYDKAIEEFGKKQVV